MIGNSVDKVLTSTDSLHNCTMDGENGTSVGSLEVMFQGQLSTCNEVKTSIVVTVALLSGIVMVSSVTRVLALS